MAHGFFFVLLFSCIISTNVHACNQTERNSLLSFILTLSSSPLNWTSINCCYWEGITCDQHGLVTHLHLPARGLKGGTIFPSSLGNLTHLTHLNLSHNSFYGSLDQTQFFSAFNRLEILDLSYNLLSGVLPIFSPPSSRIRVVDLSSNHFDGEIPFGFFQQTWNLISFNVSNNTFNGSIPSSICLHSSPSISLLDFSFNKFSGSISRGLGKCSKLQVFHAGNNNLSGLLPNDIYNATALQDISMAHNSLYGIVDDRIGNLTNLIILDLNSNQLSGSIPSNIGKLSNLKFIILHTNNLAGSLPQSLLNCTNLIELNFRSNNFEGVISMFNFSKFVHLSKIDLAKNYFTGIFPVSLYSCKSLRAIRLSLNDIEGQIQPEILSLKSLSFLSLSGAKLTNVTGAMKILMRCKSLVSLFFSYSFIGEEIPADSEMVEFNGFQNLQLLSVSFCELTGKLPLWLSKLKKLHFLNLSFNRITGSIPSWLGTLPRLFLLDLQSNLISGEFPKELCRLPMLVDEQAAARLDYAHFELPIIAQPNGQEALEYNYLSQFPSVINIKNNSLYGNIPTEIGQLQLLRNLIISFNNFSGNIPNQISNLINLERLDLSWNQLSGEIPTSITSLTFLASFDVSHNNLQGSIPKSTQLQGFDVSAFEGNPKLCGAPLPNECPREISTDEDDKKTEDVETEHHQVPWFYISVGLGFIFGFWGVCGSLVLKKSWRYAYFKFFDEVQDRLYVMIMVRMRMQRI